MMAASSAAAFFGMREEDQSQMKQQHSSTPTSSTAPPAPSQKKKRNQPGLPNPDREVIALSPKTLMARNRFICEVCNKGFQREQNLQLHRRGHNLPWKLKQKSTKDGEQVKKKVYLCPEPTCVHHDPSRPLGDLTGIKKHFSRKHGEKKYKCEKCSKKYAVQSDWKAHSKTCGTREYRCDCGTLFSRRDSFITHRAFCDALAQESARHEPTLYGSSNMSLGFSRVGKGISSIQDHENQSAAIDVQRLGGDGTVQFDNITAPTDINGSSAFGPTESMPSSSAFFNVPESNQDYHEDQNQTQHGLLSNEQFHALMQLPHLQNNTTNNPSSAANNIFNLGFLSNSSLNVVNSNSSNPNNNNMSSVSMLFPNQFNNSTTGHDSGKVDERSRLFSGNIMGTSQITSGIPSLYSSLVQSNSNNNNVVSPHMSATALLQKAAQMGSSTSNNNSTTTASTLLKGFRSSSSSTTSGIKSDHDLMNSIGGGSLQSSIFGGGGTNIAYGGHEQENSYGGYNANRSGLEQPVPHVQHHHSPSFGNQLHKVHQYNINQSTVGVGGSDRLTRDFLGVGGEMVRSMSSGYSQRGQQHGIDMSSLDSERKTAPKRQSFGDGSFQ